VLSKATTSRQQQKKKETKKTRRKKDPSISTKLDDLVNELEIALSQSDQQPISQLSTFLSDDDDEDKIHKSDKQQLPIPTYTPIILQSTTIHSEINSTISIGNDITFFSDDDNEEILQRKLPPSSPLYTPIIEQQLLVNEQNSYSLQVDSIIPMEVEISDKPTKYMSFLSEDDDNELVPSLSTQEYISPLELNKSFLNDNNHKSQLSDKSSSSNKQIETISKNIQDSLLNKKDQSSILDSNRIQIVLRLLNVLTQIPENFKPLRLVRRRNRQKKILEKQVIVSTEKINIPITEILEHPKFIEEINTTVNDVSEPQVSLQMEEQPMFAEEMDTTIFNIPITQGSSQVKEQAEASEMINKRLEDQVSTSIVEQLTPNEEDHDVRKNETISSESQISAEDNRCDGKLTVYIIFKNTFLFDFLEQLAIINKSSTISTSQESTVILFYLNNFFFFYYSFYSRSLK